ncbi:MAG: SPASM domain-containing protein [Candidatus Aenigmatarchaeota archaeon]
MRSNGEVTICKRQDKIFSKFNGDLMKTIENLHKNFNNSELGELKFEKMRKCLDCKYFNLCVGGCRYDAYLENHSYEAPYTLSCKIWKSADKYLFDKLPKNKKKIYDKLIN